MRDGFGNAPISLKSCLRTPFAQLQSRGMLPREPRKPLIGRGTAHVLYAVFHILPDLINGLHTSPEKNIERNFEQLFRLLLSWLRML